MNTEIIKPNKNQARTAALFLGGLCSLVYFTSYLSRYTFTVCIAEMTGTGLLTKEQAGLAAMMLFIFYGTGQTVSGILGDRFPAERLILVGLCGAAASNLILPLIISYPIAVAALWGLNGFCQSMFWPPIIKLTASFLSKEHYNSVTLAVSIAAHAANILLYLLAALCIGSLGDWRVVFAIALGLCIFTSVIWTVGFGKFQKRFGTQLARLPEKSAVDSPAPKEEKKSGKALFSAVIGSGALILLIGIILQGALKEGVTAWLPSFISDSYGESTSDAVLKSVAIPIFSIICLFSAGRLYKKLFKNEAVGAAVMFGLGTAMAAVIAFVPSLPTMLIIICAAILTASMHGVNLFLIAYLPARFSAYGRTSTVSGITNSCAYIGCAVYTYGVALLTDAYGWTATSISWLIIPLCGVLSCVIALPLWNKFIKRKNS